MPDPVNNFGIRVEQHPGSEQWAYLRLLIDGEDLLAHATGYEGIDPDVLLDSGVLLPTSPPCRAALYGRGNGFGEGCVAPVIAETDGHVRWTDFVDLPGYFSTHPEDMTSDPTADPASEHRPRRMALDVPDLTSDAAASRAEVARATEDRIWETHGRAVARLLRRELERHDEHWARVGVQVLHVGADEVPDRVLAQFASDEYRLINVSLPADPGDPAELARDLAAQLIATPPPEWVATRTPRGPRKPPVLFTGQGPYGWST